MVKGRNIGKPTGGKRARQAALKTAMWLCLGTTLSVSSTAFAQSRQNSADQANQTSNERPIVATTSPDASKTRTLPSNLQPETLKTPTTITLNPQDIKRQKKARSNRWNTQTLTQPTGLSAASQRPAQPIAVPNMQAEIMPTDVLSTEDLLSAAETPVLNINVPKLDVSSRADGVINLSSSLRGALFDMPSADNVNASVFKLDLGGQPCLGTATQCRANDMRRIDLGYAKNITKGKKNGFNLQLTPHGGLRVNDDEHSALVGALVRIGDNLREGSEMKANTWYLFAGADAEAVTYTPNSVRRLTSGDFHLQDRIIIGDAQAGVGYRLGDADLALTYFKRQATAENYSYDEDAAALSITWKR